MLSLHFVIKTVVQNVYFNFQSDHWNIVKVTITFYNYVTNVIMLLGNNPCVICSVGAVTSFLRKDTNRI